MKLLLVPLLLLGAGVGGYGLFGSHKEEVPATCDSTSCHVTVEPTGHGTCIVTCTDADGNVRCQQEIECNAACEKACEVPCQAKSSCDKHSSSAR